MCARGFGGSYLILENCLVSNTFYPNLPIFFTEDIYAISVTLIPFSHSQMCARGFGGSDSCTGDSGGPLMARHGSAWHIEGGGSDYFAS